MKKIPNSFKTPEGYFTSFTDKLIAKLSEEETIELKKNSFKVPDGYFDSLNNRIQEKLIISTPVKVVKLNSYKKYYYAVASMAAVLVLFIGLKINNSPVLSFDDIASSDIESYFDSNELGLSSYEIAEVIPVDELEIKDIIDNHLDNDIIIEYLNNSIDNFEELNLDTNE
tara:strand:- start:123819 stop:124328 length:510 start_codon:yes stop_codon:yes gene_type:complete